MVLNLRLLYSNDDGRGAATGILTPVVFSKNAECLGNGFVESLSADLNRMLDALSVYTCDPSRSERCKEPSSIFVIYSLSETHQFKRF